MKCQCCKKAEAETRDYRTLDFMSNERLKFFVCYNCTRLQNFQFRKKLQSQIRAAAQKGSHAQGNDKMQDMPENSRDGIGIRGRVTW